jgi:hypothetical protein
MSGAELIRIWKDADYRRTRGIALAHPSGSPERESYLTSALAAANTTAVSSQDMTTCPGCLCCA